MSRHDITRNVTEADRRNLLNQKVQDVEDDYREWLGKHPEKRVAVERAKVRSMGESLSAYSLHPDFGAVPRRVSP